MDIYLVALGTAFYSRFTSPAKIPVSDNYRSIALAPTLSKTFEWCLLIMYRPAFATLFLQFGFKPGLSTDLCTGLIKNVVSRYCFNDSSVFGCFLDASKAFHHVDHHFLFQLLSELYSRGTLSKKTVFTGTNHP